MSRIQLTDAPPDEGTTKSDLIAAALQHFADQGFDAASLRAIVGDAGQNISSIKYHFGSKEGLYDACVVTVARRMSIEGPGEMLKLMADDPMAMTPEIASRAIRAIVEAVIRDAQKPSSRIESRFMRREILMSGRGSDLFLQEVLSGHIDFLSALVARAEGLQVESALARLRALAIIGQTTFFLTAETLTRKAMAWDRMTDRVPELIDAIYPLHRNVKALA
ncbi:CerR family C-terminal domain-containing protein [uncultured Tateyamaria sp.]|uniref:CerR family C-terminal domain-containing protein n=1 Tax=uncultured Tateyamaria sp. TaxID=455651 RepID=UPI002622F2D1|nr:CerR family C-terminal domain-containing protein [uncultured Tateyamaria sp.]